MAVAPWLARDELAAFWYWRVRIDHVPDVGCEENVRWFQHLRWAAQTWAEAYGSCRHETMGEVDERRIDRVAEEAGTRVHLDRLLDEPVSESVVPATVGLGQLPCIDESAGGALRRGP